MDVTWLLHQIFGLDRPPRSPDRCPQPLVKVSRRSVSQHATGVVSAVLTRLTEVRYEQLTEAQRSAWLIATYDRTIQNEGHQQYFSVFGVGRASEVQAALEVLGARAHVRVLHDAIERYMSIPGESGFVGLPLVTQSLVPPQYVEQDAAYRNLSAITSRLLQDLILRGLTDFVEVEG